MGWLGNLLGSTDDGLIQNGLLGRGEVLGVDASGMTHADGQRARRAQVHDHPQRHARRPAAVPGGREPAHPGDLHPAALRPAARSSPSGSTRPTRPGCRSTSRPQPPTVTLPASEGHNSAAWILENGKPVTVVLVANQPIGVKSAKGDDVQALTLTDRDRRRDAVPDPGRQRRSGVRAAAALPGLEAAREARRRAERRRRRLGGGSRELTTPSIEA